MPTFADELDIYYRVWKLATHDSVHPRKVRPKAPDFSGEFPGGHPRAYEHAQPWHCKPFLDAVTGCIEIPWPVQSTVRVWSEDGINCFHTEDHIALTGNKDTISQFAPGHFGVNTHVAFGMPPGWGGLVLPHPNQYMDPHGKGSTVPAVVPGLLEFDWWPRQFFVVSTCPGPGKYVEFRYGEPFCMVYPVRSRVKSNLRPATMEERRQSINLDSLLAGNFDRLSDRYWKTKAGKRFANLYKLLSAEYRKTGKIDWEKVAAKGEEPDGTTPWRLQPPPTQPLTQSIAGHTPNDPAQLTLATRLDNLRPLTDSSATDQGFPYFAPGRNVPTEISDFISLEREGSYE